MSYKKYGNQMLHLCDGCGERISKNQKIREIKIRAEDENETFIIDICNYCVIKEKHNNTLLGRFLSKNPFIDKQSNNIS